jgi:methyltransferase
MLAEQALSSRNQQSLRHRGAVEPAGDVHAAMAIAYPLSFGLMLAEGGWRGSPPPEWLWAGAVVFLLGKALKYWAIATLGPRWSFRVLVLPGAPLIDAGPYRWVNHPNYLGVLGELAGAACWFGAWAAGPVVTVVFTGLMLRRVRVEDRALRGACWPGAGDPT